MKLFLLFIACVLGIHAETCEPQTARRAQALETVAQMSITSTSTVVNVNGIIECKCLITPGPDLLLVSSSNKFFRCFAPGLSSANSDPTKYDFSLQNEQKGEYFPYERATYHAYDAMLTLRIKKFLSSAIYETLNAMAGAAAGFVGATVPALNEPPEMTIMNCESMASISVLSPETCSLQQRDNVKTSDLELAIIDGLYDSYLATLKATKWSKGSVGKQLFSMFYWATCDPSTIGKIPTSLNSFMGIVTRNVQQVMPSNAYYDGFKDSSTNMARHVRAIMLAVCIKNYNSCTSTHLSGVKGYIKNSIFEIGLTSDNKKMGSESTYKSLLQNSGWWQIAFVRSRQLISSDDTLRVLDTHLAASFENLLDGSSSAPACGTSIEQSSNTIRTNFRQTKKSVSGRDGVLGKAR